MLLVLSTSIYAKDVQVTSGIDDIDITYPKYDTVMQYSNFTLHISLFNGSNGMPLYQVPSCYLHLYEPKGSHTFTSELENDPDGIDKKIFIGNNNFSSIGTNSFTIYCNDTAKNIGGFVDGVFEITKTGRATQEGASGYIPIVLSILGFLFIMYLMSKTFNTETDNIATNYLSIVGKFILLIVVYISSFFLIAIPKFIVDNFYPAETGLSSLLNIALQIHIYVTIIIVTLTILAVVLSMFFNWSFFQKMKKFAKNGEE